MNIIKTARRLKQHDETAFEEIIHYFTPLVSTIISNIAGGKLNPSDIEEVTADVFVTLWQNSEHLKEETLKSYLCCIAKSRAKDKLRKEHSDNTIDIDEIQQADDFILSEHFEKKEVCHDLKEEIKKIGEPDREILIRHYYYYQTVSKIAEALHLNVETVKTKLKRTRNKLKQAMYNRGYSL